MVYSASDANGNQAQAVRQVTVKATPVPDRSATKVTASNISAVFGTSPELSATLSPDAASGTVQFTSGEDELCRGTVTNGAVSCTVSSLPPVGTYPVTVDYSGDDAHAPSHTAIALKVTEPTLAKADTTVSAPALTIKGTAAATLKLRVNGGGSVPTGTVDVLEGKTLLGRPGLIDGSGTLTFTGGRFSIGTHTFTLEYPGDALHNASRTTVKVTVVKAPAATSTKVSTTLTRTKLRVTATVSPSNSTGKVIIQIGSKTYTITVKKGVAIKTVTRPKTKKVTIKTTFVPSDKAKYNGSTATKTLAVR